VLFQDNADGKSKRRYGTERFARKEVMIVLALVVLLGLLPATMHRLFRMPQNITPAFPEGMDTKGPSVITGKIENG
jgi:hypothetical protein